MPNDVGYFENELVEKNVGLYSKLSCKNVKIIDKYYNIYIYIYITREGGIMYNTSIIRACQTNKKTLDNSSVAAALTS